MLPLPPRHLPPLGPTRLTARERVCAEWRGINLAPLEQSQQFSVKAAGAVLPKVLSDLLLDRRRTEAEIMKVWNHLLAPEIVAHAQPTGLKNGTLFVTVDSSTWLCEILRYRRKEILDRLRHTFGRDFISKISFRVG